jgi:Tfp pilus assembly protein PilF
MSTPSPNPRTNWQAAATIALANLPGAAPDRLEGLAPRVQRLAIRAQRWLDRQEVGFADRALVEALAAAPDHPEILRLRAVTLHMRQQHAEAVELLRRASALRPDDAAIWNNLGSALGESGDVEGAYEAFRRATASKPETSASWFNLGKACDVLLRSEDAEAACSHALALDPAHLPSRLLRADVLKTLGRIDEATAEFRRVLERKPDNAEAWAGLIGMKTTPATAEDLDRLARLYRRPDLTDMQRCSIGFAYALALETHERHADAFEVTREINALRRQMVTWNAVNASGVFAAIGAAFENRVASAEPELGREVIFLVSLPRSGSTLAEQILAAHPHVGGAGEIDVLPALLREESARRGVDFPAWIGEATGADWTRLGRAYLERTAQWRRSHARSTDKNLQNWQLVGVIRAMLPGARIVECRRDALETCWSCLKHQFASDLPFVYDVDELASYWHDYDRLMRAWHARHPGAIFRHDHEALIARPEARVRALLDFCGLDFDPKCLRFHEVERDVRTASAGQVRAPLASDTARAERYGTLLDPLRAALAAGTATPRPH